MDWISTTNALPAATERVLLYTPFDVFGDDHACVGNRAAILNCTTCQGGCTLPLFTHWLPLPAAPSAENASHPLTSSARWAV